MKEKLHNLTIDDTKYIMSDKSFQAAKNEYLSAAKKDIFTKLDSKFFKFWLAGFFRRGERSPADFGLIRIDPPQTRTAILTKKETEPRQRITIFLNQKTNKALSELAADCGKTQAQILQELAAAVAGNCPADYYNTISTLHLAKRKKKEL